VLSVGEVLDAGAQDVADPVERIVFAAAVAVDVLLDPAPDLVDGGRAELDDVERVEHGDRVLEAGRRWRSCSRGTGPASRP